MPAERSTPESAASNDVDLLAAARRGDADALEALLVRYQPRLYRFGLRMCGNEADAGDVAQDSMISMARSLRNFRGDASVSSWLYAIARSFCIKKRRRSKFAPATEESLDAPESAARNVLPDPGPTPEQTAANRELHQALIRAIDALDPGQREVLILRDLEGLSAADVANVVGISVEAVKSRLHRARVAVREGLAPLIAGPIDARPPTTACPDVVLLFSRYLEGELSPSVCADMEAHLAGCDHCRATCASLKRTLAACRALPTPQLPPAVAASVKAALRAALNAT